jgi:hypothetical protein
MNKKYYKDDLHGYTAYASSKQIAWALIRNKCHENRVEIPTLDKIREI